MRSKFDQIFLAFVLYKMACFLWSDENSILIYNKNWESETE